MRPDEFLGLTVYTESFFLCKSYPNMLTMF